MDSYRDTLADLGKRVKQLRMLRNLQQGELAVRAGVAAGTVRRFEHTGKVSMENALRIATALGVEGEFSQLFQPPKYQTLDEALARPATVTRKRVRRRRS